MDRYPATGQDACYDGGGLVRPCAGLGEDADFKFGAAWPEPRFSPADDTVLDRLTGLTWTRNADIAEFPLTWDEALAFVVDMNRKRMSGHADWRLPNRRELRSLIGYQAHRPALPAKHPFEQVFGGWYWSSTSVAISPSHAWYVNLDGGRMFYGGKDQSFMVWPVRGKGNGLLAATGQRTCFDASGRVIPCERTGQDGEWRTGHPWPEPRFEHVPGGLLDRLSGLVWHRDADLARGPVNWPQALETVRHLSRREGGAWRLPNVNEMELLVDAEAHSPALACGAELDGLGEGYWTATTSVYEPDWAWALYTAKGAIGVGEKRDPHFHVMAVRSAGE